MTAPDYQGLALLLGAAGTFLSVMVSLALSIATFLRQGRMERAGRARDGRIEEVHRLVNGLSDKRNAATEKSSYAEGKLAGGDEERANPTGPITR